MIGLVWFREDLRVRDNTALHAAGQFCQKGIVGLYILDREFLKNHDTAACRVDFILRGLQELSSQLESLNIPLLIAEVDKTAAVIPTLKKMIKQINAESLFFNRQYEIDEKRRDAKIIRVLQKQRIACHSFDDQTILNPALVRTRQGGYFKVFTPFQRAWRQKLAETGPLKLLPAPKAQNKLTIKSSKIPAALTRRDRNVTGGFDLQLWPAGEIAARKRLRKFIQRKLSSYHTDRDFPALDATSQLSPYLSAGMISPRECFMAAYQANRRRLESGNRGAVTWMSELIWRDFYKYILIAAPRVSMNRAYRIETDQLPWRNNPELFQAWCDGKTGFPIIDAAMRQLNSIGWMHNRLRMITAMFLAKNLQLDWRMGEKYFMCHLIDGDLAANNGGWQWCASTGVDAVPYFRVFNPYRQSRRFDPQGDFIRRYCPELKNLPPKTIHQPNPKTVAELNYPSPIVNLERTRNEFIANFKKIISNKPSG